MKCVNIIFSSFNKCVLAKKFIKSINSPMHIFITYVEYFWFFSPFEMYNIFKIFYKFYFYQLTNSIWIGVNSNADGSGIISRGGQIREGHRHSRPPVISAYNSRRRCAQPFEVPMELRELLLATQSVFAPKSYTLNFRWIESIHRSTTMLKKHLI